MNLKVPETSSNSSNLVIAFWKKRLVYLKDSTWTGFNNTFPNDSKRFSKKRDRYHEPSRESKNPHHLHVRLAM